MSEDARATASLRLLFALAASVLLVALVGIGAGARSLALSTRAALDAVACCGTLFSSCLASPSMLHATLPWLALAVLLLGLLRAAWRTGRMLLLDRSFRRALLALHGGPDPRLPADVTLLELPDRRAFVAGLLFPRIHITRALLDSLTPAELRAVLQHEAHHRARRDPLRSLLVGLLQDLLWFLPVGRALHRRFIEAREAAADDAAARGGGSLELAGALVRLARLELSACEVPLDGAGDLQRRVERLLGAPPPRPAGRLRWLASAAVAGLLLLFLYLPLLAGGSPYVFRGCGPIHCREMECMR